MYTPDDYTFAYWFIGFALVLGGCACCAALGCSHCTDGTDDATIQVDITGVTADLDTSTCCTTLNRTYILATTPGDYCEFTIAYENGTCTTADCTQCNSTGCTVACDTPSTKFCDPLNGGAYECGLTSTITYGGDCPDCQSTETNVVSSALVCGCTCVTSGLVWDTDDFLILHPEVTWAVTGDLIYTCSCIAPDCTATLGKSGLTLRIFIGELSGNARLAISGTMINRTITGSSTFGATPVSCATEMNALALTAGTGGGHDVEFSACGTPGFCLCNVPTGLTLTYIP
tara:strand:- start:236 stop:1096 length:861 start_codon:yes stop_codon:yes gene_type:complete